jgi:hypothetical protein
MYALTIRPDRGVAVFRFHGVLTADGGRRAFQDYVTRADFSPDRPFLWDLRDVDELDVDFGRMFAAVQGMTAALRRFERDTPAVILVKDEMQYGMARMLEQIVDSASRIRISVVGSADEACAVLGLIPGDLDRGIRLVD